MTAPPSAINHCPHLAAESCQIVATMAGRGVRPHPTACAACASHATPRQPNAVTASLALGALRDDAAAFKRCWLQWAALLRRVPLADIRVGAGPGSQLFRLLKSYGFRPKPGCKCRQLAERMNALGPAGCRRERADLAAQIRANLVHYRWGELAAIAARALGHRLTWRLDLSDVIGSLIDEAIRLAEHAQLSVVSSQLPTDNGPPIDILIPLGAGSRHDDLELRYALRSIHAHATGVRCVWIVGRIPPWLHETDSLRLVPREEIDAPKASRISTKIEWACGNLDLTERFAFWNDDYLLVQDLDVRTIPAWYHGDLFRGQDSEGWQRLLNHTGEAMQAAGRPAKHYDIHVPMLIERQKYLALADWWARSRTDPDGGFTMKSVYGNHYCDAAAVPYEDAKLADKWPTRIDSLAVERPVISYGNPALEAGFGHWMRTRFPVAHAAEQIVVCVLGQFRGGTSCVAGVLHALGVPMGSGWPTRPRSNPRGTFEDRALAKLCRRAFREPGLVQQLPSAQRIRRFRRWADHREGRLIGAKHPTLCLCVPQLVAAWPAVRFVAVDRPPQESVASMARAMWRWSTDQAAAGTRRLIETREKDLAASGRPVHRVAYHDLLTDPAAAVAALIAALDLQPTEEQRHAAIASINPAFRTVAA